MTHEAMTVVDAQQVTTYEDPEEVLEVATKRAQMLKKIITKCNLAVKIGKGEHVKCEGWTTLARLNGCGVTQIGEARKRDDGAWEVRAGLRRLADGQIIAEAEHECGGEDDGVWAKRSDYAKRSMALTRAVGKVCRMNYSWIIVLAGYEATPLEEMPREPQAPTVIPHEEPPSPGEATEPPNENEWDPRNFYPDGIPVMPFGKHKDKALTELDNNYVAWAASNLDKDPGKTLVNRELHRRELMEK